MQIDATRETLASYLICSKIIVPETVFSCSNVYVCVCVCNKISKREHYIYIYKILKNC